MNRIIRLKDGTEAIPAEQVLLERDAHKNMMKTLTSALNASIVSRASIQAQLGKSYGGNRDLYAVLGYAEVPFYSTYKARYDRQEIAKACIDRPVQGSWLRKPGVVDVSGEETEFIKAFNNLNREKKIFHYLNRVDKISSIGQYGVLLMGFDDGLELDQPLSSGNNSLIYLSVYSEDNADIVTWEEDHTNERYGLPKIYSLSVYQQGGDMQQTKRVHWSRVIHIAPDALESDVYGTPRLQAVLNRLQDIELISGGSAEMYWRGARPGYAIKAKDDFDFDTKAKSELNTELEEFENQIRRYLRVQGVDVESLAPQVVSPKEHLDSLIDLVAAGVHIPKRILMGSERGELASSQDRNNWFEQMSIRRIEHVEPVIIRPVVDKLIDSGALPPPQEGVYTIDWPEFEDPGEEQQMRVAETAAKALSIYVSGVGADHVLPPEVFLQRFFNFSKEEVDAIMVRTEEIIDEEESQAAEAIQAEEDMRRREEEVL